MVVIIVIVLITIIGFIGDGARIVGMDRESVLIQQGRNLTAETWAWDDDSVACDPSATCESIGFSVIVDLPSTDESCD